jgi:RHS repeat-associated protein
MSYDGANRLVARWDDADRDGTITSAIYDVDPACAQCSNGAGRLVGLSHPAGKDSLGYDVRGRTVYRARKLDGFTFATSNSYDDRDRLTSITYPDGRALQRSYDDAGRLTAIPGMLGELDYDGRGLLQTIDYGNGTREERGHDDLMRVISDTISGAQGPLQSLGYTRDRESNVHAVDDRGPAPAQSRLAASYSDDAWHRMTSSLIYGDGVTYQYDALDNIVSATGLGDYTYDPARPNAATRAGALTLTYDAAGNVLTRGDRKLTWDALGRLTRVELADGVATYRLAGDERVVADEPHGVCHYIAPDYEVQDGLGVIYVRLGHERLARLVDPSLAAKIYPDPVADGKITAGDAWAAPAGSPVGRMLLSSARRLLYEAAPTTAYFGRDQVGSLTVETDSTGAVVGRRGYAPFGGERFASGDGDRHGFTGEERDAAGTLHFRFRDLDTTSGRWLSPDPLFAVTNERNVHELGEATTSYAYVANNPGSYSDPTGLFHLDANGNFSEAQVESFLKYLNGGERAVTVGASFAPFADGTSEWVFAVNSGNPTPRQRTILEHFERDHNIQISPWQAIAAPNQTKAQVDAMYPHAEDKLPSKAEYGFEPYVWTNNPHCEDCVIRGAERGQALASEEMGDRAGMRRDHGLPIPRFREPDRGEWFRPSRPPSGRGFKQ